MNDWICKTCGGEMIGDGYTRAITCETIDPWDIPLEPDAEPMFCERKDEERNNHANV
jgi:hypothetical protein